jgi:hypothetical protein
MAEMLPEYAVEAIIRDNMNAASFAWERVANSALEAWNEIRNEAVRPSILLRPALVIDGNQWCALYGEDLQAGVAGFGESPALAFSDFDRNWAAALTTEVRHV